MCGEKGQWIYFKWWQDVRAETFLASSLPRKSIAVPFSPFPTKQWKRYHMSLWFFLSNGPGGGLYRMHFVWKELTFYFVSFDELGMFLCWNYAMLVSSLITTGNKNPYTTAKKKCCQFLWHETLRKCDTICSVQRFVALCSRQYTPIYICVWSLSCDHTIGR